MAKNDSEPNRLPRTLILAIALVSGCAIAYEILLMRLFSIIQWHHFAFLIISLAMLGYGASGACLYLAGPWMVQRFSRCFPTAIFLFSLTMLAGFPAGQHLPFHAEELLWDPRQLVQLSTLCLLLSLPFFFAATAIGLSFMRFGKSITTIYAGDLFGASLGSLAIIILLFLVPPFTALQILSATVLVAGAAAALATDPARKKLVLLFALCSLLPFVLPTAWLQPVLSQYKSLRKQLLISGSRILQERSSPLGLLTVVENRSIPLRHAPGLSLGAETEPPEQIGIFIDGEAMTVINRWDGKKAAAAYLDQLTSALPFHLGRIERMLVMGGGGGSEVLQARFHDVPAIDAVEINKQMADLVINDYGDFSGGLFSRPGVTLHIGEGRSFLTTTQKKYDLIVIPASLSSAGAAGLAGLNETPLFTVQAFEEYLRHLAPGGFLAVSGWVSLPPRGTLKALNTAISALEKSGADNPASRIALIRSWQTTTLLIKNGRMTETETAALEEFCRQRLFDLCSYPGMTEDKANRYNKLLDDDFYHGATALLGPDREMFTNRYKFNIKPATDNSPYFSNFFKWALLPEIFALKGQGGMLLMEWGYLLLVAALLPTTLLSFLFILLPLAIHRKKKSQHETAALRRRVFLYFAAIGLAFLFLEIAFLQKLILFLGHPLYAAAAALAAFLLFAGAGSLLSQKICQSSNEGRTVLYAAGTIFFFGAIHLLFADTAMKSLVALPTAAKYGTALLAIAPLAFCMGIFFPLGLAAVSRSAPDLLPWAWGINGCASVLSAIIATIIAIHWGFPVVVGAALALYLLAAVNFPQSAEYPGICQPGDKP